MRPCGAYTGLCASTDAAGGWRGFILSQWPLADALNEGSCRCCLC